MSVKESVNFLGQQRIDVPDLKRIESGAIYDFQSLLKTLVGDTPYILKGFSIPVNGITGPATNLQVVVDGAVVWLTTDTNGSYLRVDPGTANEILSTNNSKVVGSFAANSTNYIGIRFFRKTDPDTADLVSFWDVDAKTEFTKTVPRGLVLGYEFVINTTGFSGLCPMAKIVTDISNNVVSITNCQNKLGRLGTGGATPNPYYSKSYATNPENPLTASSPSDPDPFTGGDLENNTLKDWMDAVMTELKSVKGSAYWYSSGSSLIPGVNLSDTWIDANGSVMSSRGTFAHSGVTAGQLTWTADLYLRSILGPATSVITANTINMSSDGDVAYIQLVRHQDFQPANTFTFTNGSATVTATLPVTGIVANDYVKFAGHSVTKYAQVLSVAGSTITLTSAYQGATAVGKALRWQYAYPTVSVAAPESVPAGADTYWIAKRDDHGFSNIAVLDQNRVSDVQNITVASHSLVLGQTITVSGSPSSSLDGQFIISAVSPTVISVKNPGNNLGAQGPGATISAPAKIYLRWIGELDQGEERQIDDNVTENILAFIGANSENQSQPIYSSTTVITQGTSLTKAVSDLDAATGAVIGASNQDRNLKLIDGGTWSYGLGVVQQMDINNVVGAGYHSLAATTDRIGQGFFLAAACSVTSIKLPLQKIASPAGTMTVQIWTDSAGLPGTLVATSAPVNVSVLTGTYADIEFFFTPTPLTAGVHQLVLNGSGASYPLGAEIRVHQQSGDVYPYGDSSYSTNSGSTWTAFAPGIDVGFIVYGAFSGLTWSADAYIEVPGLQKARNTILAGNVSMGVNDVAYVEINRTAGVDANLTVNVSPINSLTVTNDTVVIARGVNSGDVIVGTHSFLLKPNERLELDGALAEINRLLGQLRLRKSGSANNQATIDVADILQLDSATLSQAIGSFILQFDGAIIDFTTGTITKADSSPLGNNFTPFSVPVSQYFWYGVSLIGDAATADNRQTAVVQIEPASAANASQANAVKPNISGDIKLGAIQVYNNAGSIEIVDVRRMGVGSGSGGGAGTIKAKYLDPVSTILPTGVAVTIDGQSGVNGDLVLFTNLSSGNNQVYKLGGVGVSLTWTAQRVFNSQLTPTDGDSVRIQSGDAFHDQLAVFNGTNFLVNDVTRFFDGVSADYWELSSIKTTALTNNTTANVFTVAVASSENWTIDYSIVRGLNKEAGQLFITSDGTNASMTSANTYIGSTGVTFSAYISSGNLHLDYTTDNSGSGGTMKFFTKRWSDSPGGPSGVPSYAGGGGGGAAGGSNGDIQYNNAGTLAGDSRNQWDSTLGAINLNGLRIGALSSGVTLNDNQVSTALAIQYDKSYRFAILEYSIQRNTDFRVGRLLVPNNGTSVSLNDDYVETGSTGVTFSAAISGSNVNINYTSTNTGFTGTLKYSIRRWA